MSRSLPPKNLKDANFLHATFKKEKFLVKFSDFDFCKKNAKIAQSVKIKELGEFFKINIISFESCHKNWKNRKI